MKKNDLMKIIKHETACKITIDKNYPSHIKTNKFDLIVSESNIDNVPFWGININLISQLSSNDFILVLLANEANYILDRAKAIKMLRNASTGGNQYKLTRKDLKNTNCLGISDRELDYFFAEDI